MDFQKLIGKCVGGAAPGAAIPKAFGSGYQKTKPLRGSALPNPGGVLLVVARRFERLVAGAALLTTRLFSPFYF